MGPAPYTPLSFGKYYYQELEKDYELWPSYNSSNNPHKVTIPICHFGFWMIQLCCFSYLINNPGTDFDEDKYEDPTVFGLPKIPGIPQIPGIFIPPYIIQ